MAWQYPFMQKGLILEGITFQLEILFLLWIFTNSIIYSSISTETASVTNFSAYNITSTAQKMKFSIKYSSVNVTKSAVFCGFAHIYWGNL